MEKTKKFLNIAIGISILVCSFSLLIFSTRQNKAMAQVGTTLPNGVMVAGIGNYGPAYYVLGYNPKDGQISVLGKIDWKEMKEK